MIAAAPEAPGSSRDSLLAGSIVLWQPTHGYRVNVDAILLAAFAASGGRRHARAVDLGAGVGAVSLVLAHFGAIDRAELVEQDATLAALARRNLEAAGLAGAVHELTLGEAGLPAALRNTADVVISNPPFFDPEATRPAQDPGVRGARCGAVEPFLAATRAALCGRRARAAFAYPARSLATFLVAADTHGLVPKRIRFVHSQAGSDARLVLVELRAARPGGLVVEAPLYEWSAPGVRSPELARLTDGRAGDRR